MTDWNAYQACGVCEAKMGEACYSLLAAGPQALPSVRAQTPHSSRKSRGESRKSLADPARPQASTPATRRAARKTTAQANGWAELARRQGKI